MSHPTGPARRAAALVLTLGAVLLSGCSSDDGDAATDAAPAPTAESSSAPASPASPGSNSPAESEVVSVDAVDFDFELSEDSYSPGTYTFEVTNTGNMPHNFIVERDGEDVAGTEVLQPGQSATLEVTLEEGDYVFYCSVGQHRANGMEVPVTVGA